MAINLSAFKAVARSLMRTANRRLESYAKKGIQTPNLNSLLDNIKHRDFFNKDTGRLSMRNLSERDLQELVEVQRKLRKMDTPRQWEENVRDIYRKNADLFPQDVDVEKIDVNYFTRAMESFHSKHGGKYRDWGDWVVEHGEITSKGDTLAQEYRKILQEYTGKEFSQEELKKIFNQKDTFENKKKKKEDFSTRF